MTPTDARYRRLEGALLVLGPAGFLLALLVGAAVVPGYHLGANAISDLGVAPASAALFTAAVVLVGLANVVVGWLERRRGARTLAALPALAGVGAVGVGVFPETTGAPHVACALLAFVGLTLEAAAFGRRRGGVLGALGVGAGFGGFCALCWFVAGDVGALAFGPLGVGGVERLVAYPALLWFVAYGGALLGAETDGTGV